MLYNINVFNTDSPYTQIINSDIYSSNGTKCNKYPSNPRLNFLHFIFIDSSTHTTLKEFFIFWPLNFALLVCATLSAPRFLFSETTLGGLAKVSPPQ